MSSPAASQNKKGSKPKAPPAAATQNKAPLDGVQHVAVPSLSSRICSLKAPAAAAASAAAANKKRKGDDGKASQPDDTLTVHVAVITTQAYGEDASNDEPIVARTGERLEEFLKDALVYKLTDWLDYFGDVKIPVDDGRITGILNYVEPGDSPNYWELAIPMKELTLSHLRDAFDFINNESDETVSWKTWGVEVM